MCRFASLIVIAVALAASSGCSPTYVAPPPVDTKPMSSGPGRGREVIVVGPFDDVRDDRRRCGVQKNGFGLEVGDVVCTAPVGEWVADAFAARLSREGYRVLSRDAAPGASTIIVRASVKKLWVEPQMFKVEGYAAVDLVVTSPSGFRSEKTVDVRVQRPAAISTEDVYQTTAEQTTSTLAIDMATALGGVLQDKPDLGAPGATRAESLATSGSAGGAEHTD